MDPCVTAQGWLAKRAPSPRGGCAPCPTDIPDSEFQLLLRRWLGLPILQQGRALPKCPMCKDTLDPHRDHFVCCERDAFFVVCAQHNVAVAKTQNVSPAGGRHSPHELVTRPPRRGGFCVHPPSRGGTSSPGRGAHREALQPGRNLESACGSRQPRLHMVRNPQTSATNRPPTKPKSPTTAHNRPGSPCERKKRALKRKHMPKAHA